jgi:hypothetical protein
MLSQMLPTLPTAVGREVFGQMSVAQDVGVIKKTVAIRGMSDTLAVAF